MRAICRRVSGKGSILPSPYTNPSNRNGGENITGWNMHPLFTKGTSAFPALECHAVNCSKASGTISRSRKKNMCDLGQIKAARGWVSSTKFSPSRVAEKLTLVSSSATVEFAHNGQVTSCIVELGARCIKFSPGSGSLITRGLRVAFTHLRTALAGALQCVQSIH